MTALVSEHLSPPYSQHSFPSYTPFPPYTLFPPPPPFLRHPLPSLNPLSFFGLFCDLVSCIMTVCVTTV